MAEVEEPIKLRKLKPKPKTIDLKSLELEVLKAYKSDVCPTKSTNMT